MLVVAGAMNALAHGVSVAATNAAAQSTGAQVANVALAAQIAAAQAVNTTELTTQAAATQEAIATPSHASPVGSREGNSIAAATEHAPAKPGARPFASPDVTSASPDAGFRGLGQVTLSLAIVLAAIFAVAWLARRMRTFGQRGGALIDVIASVQLGAKERAVLLRVGTKQILVGVTPASVNALHVLDTPIELPASDDPSSPERPNFRALLMRSLGKS